MQSSEASPATATQCWQRLGRLYVPPVNHWWIRSHANLATPLRLSPDITRIYFGARGEHNRTLTMFVDVAANDPLCVRRICDEPVLSLGNLGCFDDCGVMPSCVVPNSDQLLLYYTGWNTSTTVPYRNSIGIAASNDNGETFHRLYDGPIVDRTSTEPHFCASPFVMRDGGIWRMWHLSCTDWTMVDGVPEARYLIRHRESDDGLVWRRPGTIAIDYLRPDEAMTRPWVIKDVSGYQMWYCYRSISQYRRNPERSYRLGYATSSDGLSWKRRDELPQFAGETDGWDDEMIAYPSVFDTNDRRCLLYSGNGFGKTGIGLAELAR